MYIFVVKRTFDFLVALLLLLIFSPLFFTVWVLLLINNNGKPFFVQRRPGKHEAIFSIFKFKTMNDKKDSKGNLLPDTLRLTRIGKIIRKTSLDELPQLLNVLLGDMSFVGPRPLLIEYLDCYYSHEKIRHDVRPGITGLAQVSGRNLLAWEERLQKDVDYVNNVSFFLDLTILLKTVSNVLFSKGVVIDPQSTMLSLCEERNQKNIS